MNKVNLIQALKDANNLTKSEAEKIVTLFFDKIRRTGKRGSC
jgi:nucleoid DNA-binding protein